MSPTKILSGIPAAPGLTKGKILIHQQKTLQIPDFVPEDKEAEVARLLESIEVAGTELDALRQKMIDDNSEKEAEIFEAHRLILMDDSLISMTRDDIREGVNAERAWSKTVEFFAEQLEAIPDETLAARAADIRDVGRRVVRHLLGVESEGFRLTEPTILVGRDLTPSDTANVDKKFALGFLTAEGGPTSHTAILAKAFGLPAVVGLGMELLEQKTGAYALVDGNTGVVIFDPDPDAMASFDLKFAKAHDAESLALAAAFDPAITKDGLRVEVVANIGGEEDALFANEHGAEGVGLFRTEFLYLHRVSEPTEEEQVVAYQQVFKHFKGQPVVVRTLDIGGDKEVPYMNFPKELNPFLGWRGVRMLEGREDLMVTQIRALLRSSIGVDLRVMVPMIARLDEILAVRKIIDEQRAQLDKEGIPYGTKFQFGIMVEVPSAALMADKLARYIDFFSIGTNDLTQYTLAVDRTNSRVAEVGTSFDPSVLILIDQTIKAAHNAGKWCGMCGEFAGEELAIPILLGMGLDEFSVSSARVPAVKQLLRKLSKKDCEQVAVAALDCSTATEVKTLVDRYLQELA